MNKKRINILLALLLSTSTSIAFSASTTNKGSNPNGRPFVELNGEVIEIYNETVSLEEQIDSLVTSVGIFDDKVLAYEETIRFLERQTELLQAQIDQNSMDMESLQETSNILTIEVSELKAQLTSLGYDDAELIQAINENEALLRMVNQTISEGQLVIEELIAGNSVSIDGVSYEVDQYDADTGVYTVYFRGILVEVNTNEFKEYQDQNKQFLSVIEQRLEDINDTLLLKQNIINGECAEGSSVREVSEDGSVTCEYDDDNRMIFAGFYPRVIRNVDALVPVGTGVYNVRASCPAGYNVVSGGYKVKPYTIAITSGKVFPEYLVKSSSLYVSGDEAGWQLSVYQSEENARDTPRGTFNYVVSVNAICLDADYHYGYE